jgi:hypothetical protein
MIIRFGSGSVWGSTRILRVIPRAGRPCHFFKLTHYIRFHLLKVDLACGSAGKMFAKRKTPQAQI